MVVALLSMVAFLQSSFGWLFQNKKGSLARNTLLMSASSAVTLVGGIVFTVVIARSLTIEDFGAIGLALSVAAIVALLPAYGFDLFVIRELVQNKLASTKVVANILVVKCLFSAAALVAADVFIARGVTTDYVLVFWLFIIAEIIHSFSRFLNSVSKANEDFVAEATTVAAESLVQLVLVVLIQVILGLTADLVGWIVLCSRSIGLVLSAWMLWRRQPGGFRQLRSIIVAFDPPMAKRLTFDASPFAGQLLLGGIYYRADTIILGQLASTTSVGYYFAARRLIESTTRVSAVFIGAFFPRISSEYVDPPEGDPNRASRLLIHVMLVSGAFFALLFYVGAEPIMGLLYGDQLAAAAPALKVLGIAMALRFLAGAYGTILVARRHQLVQLSGAALASVLTITLNLILIPRYGFMAAAWTSVAVHVVILILYGVYVKRSLGTLALGPRQIAMSLKEAVRFLQIIQAQYHKNRTRRAGNVT